MNGTASIFPSIKAVGFFRLMDRFQYPSWLCSHLDFSKNQFGVISHRGSRVMKNLRK